MPKTDAIATTTAGATLVDVLADLLRSRRDELLSNRRRLLGLLRDKAPAEQRATRLLMLAFDQGVPVRLAGATISADEIDREGARVAAETGVAPELAREAVLTWVRALGRPSQAERPAVEPVSVQPLPEAPRSVQPIPVSPIPVSPLPTPPSIQSIPSSAAPQGEQGAPRASALSVLAGILGVPTNSWAKILVAVAIGVGVISQFASKGSDTQAPSSEAPQQTPASPSAPAAAPRTPEGVPLVTTSEPIPTFNATRFKDGNPNSLNFQFGVRVGAKAMLYQVGVVFDRNSEAGRGIVNANADGKLVTTGAVPARRPTGQGGRVVVMKGAFQHNVIGALPFSIMVQRVAPRLDELDLQQNAFFCVYDPNGGNTYGCGFLQ